jgi:hypothetical protein
MTIARRARTVLRRLPARLCRRLALLAATGEGGMTTAELLGNAALGIDALVAFWAVLQTLGLDVVDWMRGQLRV